MIVMLFDRLPWFDSRFCLLLTWTLIHFVWQGCLLAIGFAIIRRWLIGRSANFRYAAGLFTLLLMAACLPANLWLIDPPATPHRPVAHDRLVGATLSRAGNPGFDQASDNAAEVHSHFDEFETATAITNIETDNSQNFWSHIAQASSTALASISTYATVAYALGLALMLARVFVGLSIGRRLRRRASTAVNDAAMLELVRVHAARLALRAVPAIAWCSRVSVPVVVGMLRPMILLPASLATGLTSRQLEYVLLHELAHIHRYDPLANLLQRLIEALLFFHPAVWWLTRQVSIERENACDDVVLHAGCHGPAYAESLLRVAELCVLIPGRSVSPAGLLAATGENPSQLARRIHRLFNVDPPATSRPATPGVAMLVLLGAGTIIGLAAWRSPATAQVAPETAAASNATSTAAAATASEEQGAAPSTDKIKTPNPVSAVAGVLARQRAWRSGSFDFRWEGAVAGQSVGVRDNAFAFDGDRWKKTLLRGAEARHKDCTVEFIGTLQNDGTTRSTLSITPNWLVAEGKAGEPVHEEAASPPNFAGTLSREGEARFLAANAAAGKFLEMRVVNGVESQVFEWILTKTDVWALGSFPPSLFDGGRLRLFVSEAMNYVLPRVELLTPEGNVAVAYDGLDFREFAPGLFIPLQFTRLGTYTETYTLSNVSLINDELPDAAFQIAIPVGTQVLDHRGVSPIGRHPGDDVTLEACRITELAQLAAMPRLRDLVQLDGAPSVDEKPADNNSGQAVPPAETVVEIRVVGNETHTTDEILDAIETRVGNPFDQRSLENDVRTLSAKKWFHAVQPFREQVAGGVRLTFEVIDRPANIYVRYLRNSKIKQERLTQETDLPPGSSLDREAIEEGRAKIEQYYRDNGFPDVRIEILHRAKADDHRVIYMIHDVPPDKTGAAAPTTNTSVESKSPTVDRSEKPFNVMRDHKEFQDLYLYYMNLGFLDCSLRRESILDPKWDRPQRVIVVNEGPQYRIGRISFHGSRQFTDEELAQAASLQEGQIFRQQDIDQAIHRIKEMYRTQRHFIVNVRPAGLSKDEPVAQTLMFGIDEADYLDSGAF